MMVTLKRQEGYTKCLGLWQYCQPIIAILFNWVWGGEGGVDFMRGH